MRLNTVKTALLCIVLPIAVSGCGESKEKVVALENRVIELEWKLDKQKRTIQEARQDVNDAEVFLFSANDNFMSGNFNGGLSDVNTAIQLIHRAKSTLE